MLLIITILMCGIMFYLSSTLKMRNDENPPLFVQIIGAITGGLALLFWTSDEMTNDIVAKFGYNIHQDKDLKFLTFCCSMICLMIVFGLLFRKQYPKQSLKKRFLLSLISSLGFIIFFAIFPKLFFG